MTSDAYIVKPVYKALQVLQCLADGDLTLTEICYRAGLPKTTVFRYLATLRALGFVAHDPETDLYRLGLRLWELGQVAGGRGWIREVARPLMHELRDRFNETVNLAVLDGPEIVYLEIVESRRSLRMQTKPSSRDPVYSTALGKALLAFLPEPLQANHLPATLLPRTQRTITSLGVLRQELAQTRARGYALDRGENEEGAYCVAAPILDPQGHVRAAISVSAPASRLNGALEQDVSSAIMQTAAAISQRLSAHSLRGEERG